MGKLHDNQKMAKECYYVSLKSLCRKQEPLPGEISRQNKVGKEVAEVMVVLSASADEHERPRPKPTFEVVPNHGDTECLA